MGKRLVQSAVSALAAAAVLAAAPAQAQAPERAQLEAHGRAVHGSVGSYCVRRGGGDFGQSICADAAPPADPAPRQP